LYTIISDPSRAFLNSMLPVDGVGLVRMEFLLTHIVKAHPLALLRYPDFTDPTLSKTIFELLDINGYDGSIKYAGENFFVSVLTEGIATIAAAFYPKPVVIRLSDFKSNEYKNLIGGNEIELIENNPMLGLRGASRYISEEFKFCLAMEAEAIRRVTLDMKLDNIRVLVPFVRTSDELKEVSKQLRAFGVVSPLLTMCELPVNALEAPRFLEHCNGMSIGSNDLTQLTLGIDRDSQQQHLVNIFSERNSAVLSLMKMAIQACKNAKKTVGICGQGPADDVELLEWLVRTGVDSISVTPDAVLRTKERLILVEKALIHESTCAKTVFSSSSYPFTK